ncbi:NDR1/HIN1-like protein 10 [Aristolochia californica]|uniref:NDR1/HIN1-like protein 10 n=1 Tax=Aristolochia californica TaxID=171875 RepID=UPI0035D6940C
MGEQTHLNGAYYGPPIPPRPHSYRRPGRGSSCCCGPCCLLSFLFKFIVSLVIIAGIIALIVWLALRPARVKVHVDTAELSQFNLTNGNVLHYNLSLSVSVRNPNKRIGIYYDRLEARAFYQGQRLDSRFLPTFYQGHKNTTMLYPAFSGQQLLVLGSQDVNDFEQQKREGRFEVDVKIYARIRFKVGKFKTNRYTPDAECDLRMPLTTGGSAGGGFSRTKCDIDF